MDSDLEQKNYAKHYGILQSLDFLLLVFLFYKNESEKKPEVFFNQLTTLISGVNSSPEIYLSKSIVTDGGNY